MTPTPVVEHLDPLEHRCLRCIPRRVDRSVDELSLECAEEALGHGVVPAITRAAHALAHACSGQRSTATAARFARAICSAETARWRSILESMAHPTIRREYRSRRTAR